MQRLQIEQIDILLLHSPPKGSISDEINELFEKARDKGFVRDYGVSARSFEDLKLALNKKFGSFFQWNFSLLERRVDPSLLNNMYSQNQYFIGRSLLYRGLLTEFFLQHGPNVNFEDARSQLPQSLRTWVYENLLRIKKLSSSINLTVSEFSLIYAFMNSNIHLNLVGVRSFENLKSIEKILAMSRDDLEAAQSLVSNFEIA